MYLSIKVTSKDIVLRDYFGKSLKITHTLYLMFRSAESLFVVFHLFVGKISKVI